MANFEAWFDVFRNAIKQYEVRSSDIYNVDETGFRMGDTGRSYIVVSKKQGYTGKTPEDRGEGLTVIECASATGTAIPPFIIFKGKSIQSTWVPSDAPLDWMTAVSPKGWTSNALGYKWLTENFDPQTREKADYRYRMLILDGHGSHLTVPFIRFCMRNRIVLLCLPAHTSHMLQPLDVGVFSPHKYYYRRASENILRDTHQAIPKSHFINIYVKIRSQALTVSNIKSGFIRAGLVPFNPKPILLQLPRSEVSKMRPVAPEFEYFTPVHEIATPHNLNELHRTSAALAALDLGSETAKKQAAVYHEKILRCAEESLSSGAILGQEHQRLVDHNEENRKNSTQKCRRIMGGRAMSVEAVLDKLKERNKKKVPKQSPRTQRQQRSPTSSIVDISDDESIEEDQSSNTKSGDSKIYSCIQVEDDE
jgi:hypothetical protein